MCIRDRVINIDSTSKSKSLLSFYIFARVNSAQWGGEHDLRGGTAPWPLLATCLQYTGASNEISKVLATTEENVMQRIEGQEVTRKVT